MTTTGEGCYLRVSEVSNLFSIGISNAGVVAYESKADFRTLPQGGRRTNAEGKVTGKASQDFKYAPPVESHFAGYIMGRLVLPPNGIKDAESVGECSQVFTIVSGQPGAMEVAYSDPNDEDGEFEPETASRFLLSPGDMFRVHSGNCYRLQNHSKTTECAMTFTIIRPHGVKPNGGSN